MQSVSTQYKESMKQIGRNRGYIKVSIGIVNSEAQESLVVDGDDITYYSNDSVLKGEPIGNIYATCEQNWSKTDGTMYFLPPSGEASYYNNGLVSTGLNGEISFGFSVETPFDIAGFTIDFGENYPTDFTISSGGKSFDYHNNDKQIFVTEIGFHEVTEFTVKANTMRYGSARLRIYSISMGVSNNFTNETVTSYTQNDYVSSIADTLPSSDTTITVANYDQKYNPDNESSLFTFFEVGQEVRVSFGYDVDGKGNVEWLPETISHLKTWSATDTEATFGTSDIFDYISGTYYRGKYYSDGISLYDLAEDVLEDAGITNYNLDSFLQSVIVNNPIPVVSHTEALQIIANAGRCEIREGRDGSISILSSFIPKATVSSSNQTYYSNVENIVSGKKNVGYAVCSKDFTVLSDDLKFLGGDIDSNVGYVSKSIADSNGTYYDVDGTDGAIYNDGTIALGSNVRFVNWKIKLVNSIYSNGKITFDSAAQSNPKIKFVLEASSTPSGFSIMFRNTSPKEFVVRTYENCASVEEFTVTDPNVECNVSHSFLRFDAMEIEFTKGRGNDRVFIDSFTFGAPTDYTIYRNMMTSAPVASREERIKSLNMTVTSYSENDESKNLLTTEIKDIEEDDVYYLYLSNASYDYSVTVDEGSADVEVVYSSSYMVSIKLTNVASTDIKVSIEGKEYSVNEQIYVVQHNTNGIEKSWGNPLISTNAHASAVESWLADYFLYGITYEFEWRGDPRCDADDLFYLELKSGETANVRCYNTTLNFNGAWSAKAKARKVVV